MGIIVHDQYVWAYGNLTDTYLTLKDSISVLRRHEKDDYIVKTQAYRMFGYGHSSSNPIEIINVAFVVEKEFLENPYTMVFNHLKQDLISFENN